MLPAILIIFLLCVISALLMRLLTLHRAMDSLTRELKEIICAELPSHRHLQVPVPDHHLELLAEQINCCLTDSFSRSYEQKKREQDIRQEITNISHDLRTPLTSILGYLQLLEESPLTDEQLEYIQIIGKRSSHLHTLISQLYEYARLETRELPLDSREVDLCALLREHLLSFYQEFEDKGMELRPQLPPGPVMINGDNEALERILHNLTSNMLRHGQGLAFVTLSMEQNQALLVYSNHSPGLSTEEVSHLFDPFYTAEQARTSQRSGLGMTVARLLAEQMGGSMEASFADNSLRVCCRFPVCLL